MKPVKFASLALVIAASVVLGGSPFAQDLGPRVKKLADGVYVHTGKGFDSNSGIIITDEGVIVVDTGQNAVESRLVMEAVKKLTPLPVRIVIDTEPHNDHTTGHFLFPQAVSSRPPEAASRCAARMRLLPTGSKWRAQARPR